MKKNKKNDLIFLIVMITLFIIQNFTIGFVPSSGSSMIPAIDQNLLIVLRVGYTLNREDIIICRSENKIICKRIIGMPGDDIYIHKNGQIDINGKQYKDVYKKETLKYIENKENKYIEKKITLKDNEYFIMGDNRMNSRDSRYFGPVYRKNIKGKVIKII